MLTVSSEPRLKSLPVIQRCWGERAGYCNELSTVFALRWGEGGTDLACGTFSRHFAGLAMRRIGMYDVRPDQVGWTVFDVETGRAAVLNDLVLTQLEHETADQLAALLNRQVYAPRAKRLSRWPLPAAPRPQSNRA
jgi:hypothetical protein